MHHIANATAQPEVEEIEVTPEMIEAGVATYSDYSACDMEDRIPVSTAQCAEL